MVSTTNCGTSVWPWLFECHWMEDLLNFANEFLAQFVSPDYARYTADCIWGVEDN